jgi:hypothetical protein
LQPLRIVGERFIAIGIHNWRDAAAGDDIYACWIDPRQVREISLQSGRGVGPADRGRRGYETDFLGPYSERMEYPPK